MLREQGKGITGSEILCCLVSRRVFQVETVFLPSGSVIYRFALEKMTA